MEQYYIEAIMVFGSWLGMKPSFFISKNVLGHSISVTNGSICQQINSHKLLGLVLIFGMVPRGQLVTITLLVNFQPLAADRHTSRKRS